MCSRDRKTCQYFNHWTEKQVRRKLSFQKTFFLSTPWGTSPATSWLTGIICPWALPSFATHPPQAAVTASQYPQQRLSLPASPKDLSKLFALAQLLFMGSDTKDKGSYGILYLGKCHASYIQLSTTMPSALCYLQKADFRRKWTTANQSLLLGKRGEF